MQELQAQEDEAFVQRAERLEGFRRWLRQAQQQAWREAQAAAKPKAKPKAQAWYEAT